ncbi:uncharacterized protein LOC6557839 [Drosophila grimshawi]|uniref:GH16456 n=1 Tax=Drosophila grimshawi TaxID=7222 RepID=B4J0E8_DROGR|nr:uncharacterized protein LOC6557839 [Drosophila grimshawi]EDV96784.1 GH16456 [Drosophila grimshawi]
MHKRFRKTADVIFEDSSSSSSIEACASISFVQRKYMRKRRREAINVELNISGSSSDDEQLAEQENKMWLKNLKRCSSSQKPLQLTPQNKFQPLSLSVSAKSPSPTPPMPGCALEPTEYSKSTPAAWNSFRKTLAALKQEQRGLLQTSMSNCSHQSTLLDCSIEANLETMIDTQKTPRSATKVALTQMRKKRCVKGGYVHEYKKLMLKERMDRRSLAHNQRLGISSGQQVRVLAMSASFGTHMARVQTEAEPKAIFNIIVAPSMVSNVKVDSKLELYIDLQLESPLQLPNKELIYLQPNKIVLL